MVKQKSDLEKWLSLIALVLIIWNLFFHNSLTMGMMTWNLGNLGVLIIAIVLVLITFNKK
ncbi:MAG: hypothetical protein KKF56_00875 [Nanoarchaeota archaeon]|nr:hypothetical protein [Nanoarchaeota archaeon]